MIKKIRDQVKKLNFKITDHAFEEMRADGLDLSDVTFAIMNGDIIENYPAAYPLAACLINGATRDGDPVHICISLPPVVKVITVYQPDPSKWKNNFTERR